MVSNATPREMAFLVCLSESYELAGRKVADTTIISAAKDMSSRIPCADNEIKELFLTAREFSDIPTTKTLWKAWNYINDNRPPAPKTVLTYDVSAAIVRKVNIAMTLQILAHKLNRDAEYIKAYATELGPNGQRVSKYPGLKHDFDSQVIPFMHKICGNWLGQNPNDPHHPIQRYKGVTTNGK